jgi:hypothetical protein
MFRLGSFASEKKVNGAIVLAPSASGAACGQDYERRCIALKILESFRIKGAWLESRELRSGYAYAKALMDLL